MKTLAEASSRSTTTTNSHTRTLGGKLLYFLLHISFRKNVSESGSVPLPASEGSDLCQARSCRHTKIERRKRRKRRHFFR